MWQKIAGGKKYEIGKGGKGPEQKLTSVVTRRGNELTKLHLHTYHCHLLISVEANAHFTVPKMV